MKCFSSAMCGILLVLPLTASGAFAQTSTTPSSTGSSHTAASRAQSTSPSSRGVTSLDPTAPPPPAHPITTEQTRELLDLMNYKKMEQTSWSQMIAMNKQAAPFIPDDVWTDVQGGINGIDYVAIMQPIYAKYLSTEEAAKALEFYRTPAGKKVLQSMPPILGESVAASQQKGRQVGRDAIEKHRPEIEAAQKKYQAEHPPATGSGSGMGPGAGTGSRPGSPAGSSPGSATPSTPPTPKPQQ